MTSQKPSGDLISDRYASALYDLAADSKIVDQILNDLEFSFVTVEDKIVILGEYLKISQEIDIELLHEIIYQNIPDL